jgi:hypothetical protein
MGSSRQRKPDPRPKPRCTQNSRWIVVKTSRMQNAKLSAGEITQTIIEVDQAWVFVERGVREWKRERVDAEITPLEILFEATWLHARKAARMGVSFAPRSRKVDLNLIELDPNRSKTIVASHPCSAGRDRRNPFSYVSSLHQ